MDAAAAREALALLAAALAGRAALLLPGGAEAADPELLRRIPPCKERPWFVAKPESVADVQACVRCASNLGIPLSVIGGAHSPYSTAGRLVLDLQSLNGVEVDADARTVTVGGGAIAKQILETAAKHRLMIPLGTAPTVGLGLVLQGGVGHLSRYGGLSLDRLLSVELVVADGERLTVTRGDHPELFWALAGCGPNFGVVVSATLSACELRPLAVHRRLFGVPEAPDSAGRLLAAYGELAAALPRHASADCILHYGVDGALRLGVYDYFLHGLGECVHERRPVGEALVAAKWEAMEEGLEPCVSAPDLFDDEPYLSEQPRGTLLPAGEEGLGFFVRAVFAPAPLPAAMVEQLLAGLRAAPCRHCYVHLQHAGGAVADRAPGDTAFAARGLEWSVVITGCWPKPARAGLEAECADWVQRLASSLLPSALGTYATDLGPEDAGLAALSFGENLPELLRLKRLWDPGSVFTCGFPLKALSGPAA